MPNWCTNRLVVEGHPARVAEFAKAVANETASPREPLSFSRLLPIEVPNIDEQVEAWGTKWDLDSDTQENWLSDSQLEFIFDTAWSPPQAFVRSASEKFPGINFSLAYYELGNVFAGQIVYKDGEEQEEYSLKTVSAIREFCVDEFGYDPMEGWDDDGEPLPDEEDSSDSVEE